METLLQLIAAHSGESGFKLLTTGSESFTTMLSLIRTAQKTIDLQYYSINNDTTSNLLLEALLQAGKRGVKIRFLLDNINFEEVREMFCMLNTLRDIDVRVFRPYTTPEQNIFTQLNFDKINRRMHNKALIIDNQMTVIGGRNLGDAYFEEHTNVTFRDIDVLALGPIVKQILQNFDQYWQSEDAIPLNNLHPKKTSRETLKKIRAKLSAHWKRVQQSRKGRKILTPPPPEYTQNATAHFIWAQSELVADTPQKNMDATSPILTRLNYFLEIANNEFLVVSPYFVPRDAGVEKLTNLVKRGLKVKVLTNSLASTDVVAVHTGYRRYRKPLLHNGIELYELKPIDGKRPHQRLIGKKAPARASLHAKVYTIDQQIVMIGSFNLDPRSIEINYELALIIHSPELAAEVRRMFEEVISLDTSYHLSLSNENPDKARIIWKAKEKNKQREFTQEPRAGIWRRIETAIISLLPIEDQL